MKLSLRRFICFLVLGLLSVTSFPACNTANNTRVSQRQSVENCRVVQHTMGETCIPRNPQRVVSLSEDIYINALELGVRSIATVYVPDFPFAQYLQGKVEQLESVGSYDAVNLEKILLLKPDLILARPELESIHQQLSHIAPTVVLNQPFPPPPWQEQFQELALVLDKEETAQQLIDNYWQRVKKLQQALGDRRKTMKVSIANTSSEYGIWSYGEKHPSGSILKDVGLQRPELQTGDFFYIENISLEKIFAIDGDVLFFVSWKRKDDRKTLEKLKQSPLWSKLEVVQRDQVYLVGRHWHNSDILAINAILNDLFKYLVDKP